MDLLFSGFKLYGQGQVRGSLLITALEGDPGLGTVSRL